jgi:phosphoribosylaminoimidazole-succinocarboxamide synthase
VTDRQWAWGLENSLAKTDAEGLGIRYDGKVRDVYTDVDRVVLVASDRISAFDHVLRQTIPYKGQVLTRVAQYAFEQIEDLVPHHVREVPHGNVTVAHRCTPYPVEFVVRGYLAGHAWRVYRDGERELCGMSLPDGLREGERLPAPLLTPATKAEFGHDEDISAHEIVARGILTQERFDEAKNASLLLFARGSESAAERGLILVDTKYEFGLDNDARLRVIDEIHTPDSSRYYYADGYSKRLASGEPQRQLSKEFVREWLMDNGFQGRDGDVLPDLTDDFRVEVGKRYVELYETLTGRTFEPDTRPIAQTLNRLASDQ